MRRNNIELYWAKIDKAPEGAIAQVRVTDDVTGSEFLLPFPCKLTKEGRNFEGSKNRERTGASCREAGRRI